MRELNQLEKRQIQGGGGISGAFLDSIGGILKAGLGFISDMYNNIVTTVFLFQHPHDYDKLDIKLGSNEIKYDRTDLNKAATPVLPPIAADPLI